MAFIEYRGFDHVWWYAGPWLYYLIAFYCALPFLAYIVLPYFTPKRKFDLKRKIITLFVLGDIGHSPRMTYHARSLSKLDYFVTVCGYLETRPAEDIIDDVNIDLKEIKPIRNTSNLPFLVFAIKKIVLQCFQLLDLLWEFAGSSDYIMIQNPPSIPILLLAVLYIKLLRLNTKIIVDWHNLNYSILNLKYNNEKHPLVRILKSYERILAKYVDYHITVTNAMKQFLIDEFDILHKKGRNIFVLHDRPAEAFAPLGQLNLSRSDIVRNHDVFSDIPNLDKYRILVSSTSFTADEDFNVLLDALKQYDTTCATDKLPPIVLIVTGKGPLKPAFLARVEALKFLDNVIIRSAWLSYEDYPLILASADLAISLHTSSSGIDLPMKIVDFFGCGVPVITLSFAAIGELVKDGENGLITKADIKGEVSESQEIFRLLTQAFTDDELLQKIKKGAMAESQLRWDENWDNSLSKLFPKVS